MAIFADAAVLVTPPSPPRRPYGLFDVVEPERLPRIEAEAGGIEYQPDTCGTVRLWASECEAVTAKVFDSGVDTLFADPFITYDSWLCGSIGYDIAEIRNRLRVRMSLGEQRAVEARLWQGGSGLGIDGLFADATSLGTAACLTEGVRLLEQALADNGIAGGIIHARSGMSAYFAAEHLVEDRNGRQETRTYTPVVFGQGYSGVGPAGEAPTATTEWVYATGRVRVWRGDFIDIVTRENLDRLTNQQYAVLERPYMTTIECGVWAVNVTRECPGA